MKSSTTNNHRVKRLGQALLISTFVVSAMTSPAALAGDKTAAPGVVPTRLPSVSAAALSSTASKPKRLAKPAISNVNQVRTTSAIVGLPELEQAQPRPVAKTRQLDWLRSGTSGATNQVARRILSQAHSEFRVGAWLSAETSAWESIRWSAESIDQNLREAGTAYPDDPDDLAISKLQVAKRAIMEARDFAIHSEGYSPVAISRMAASHQTDVLDDQPTQGLSSTDASDRYLDFARVHLAAIASQSIEAAEALDLLAAIYLRRAEAKTLPSATALCMRRAAIQGQPDNASLAANLGTHLMQVGLYGEARWALGHSLSIDPKPETADALAKLLRQTGNRDEADAVIASIGQQQMASNSQSAIKIPEITQLTPDEFASLSKSVVWNDNVQAVKPAQANPAGTQSANVDSTLIDSSKVNANQVNATLTSSRVDTISASGDPVGEALPSTIETVDSPKPTPLQRLKNSWRRLTN